MSDAENHLTFKTAGRGTQMTEDRVRPARTDPPRDGIWTSRRQRLHEVLSLRGDATVADLYRRAIDAFSEDPLSTGSLVVGSHCIREFVNRLPRVLAEVEVHGFRGDGSSEKLLARALEQYDDDPSSTATVHLADAVRDLLGSRREGSDRAAQMREALVLGNTDASGGGSTLRAVKRAIDWFEKYRHPQEEDLSRWPTSSAGPVIEHLEVIEQALYGRLGRFFDVVADLRDLLEAANATNGDEWVTPAPAMVRGAIPRLADPQHRRVFFAGLNNPRWMAELDAQRVFSDPPLRHDDPERSMPYQAWPQGDYLRKMAVELPVESAEILARVFRDDVAWSVHELIVATAGEVPPEAAAILAKPVVACVTSGFASRFIGVDTVTVVVTLASGNRSQRRKAKMIANSLLEPFRDPQSPARPLLGRFTVISHVDQYDYEDAVRRVVEAFAGDLSIFADLARWLAREQVLSGTFDPGGYDMSHIRRPSIAKHRHHATFDTLGDVLIDAVRDCSADLITSAGLAPVLHTLRKHAAPIFVRIELHCLGHELQRAIEHDQSPSHEALAEAVHHLADPELAGDRNCHRELDLLATATLPHLEEADYLRWENAVLSEPNFDEETKARIASFSPINLAPDEAVTDYVERSRLHRLAAVGPKALRGRALAMYENLTAKHGRVPDYDESAEWREDSDAGFGFEDMSPSRVLAETVRQCAAQDRVNGSGDTIRLRDHLGRAFGQAIRLNPGGFSDLADQIVDLDPHILHYFLSGLTDALRSDVSDESLGDEKQPTGSNDGGEGTLHTVVNWEPLLGALTATDVRHESPSSFESDETWRSVRKDLCRLLEAGAASDLPTPLLGPALTLAAAMSSDADPTSARDGELHAHAVRDPLSYSANTVRSSAVHTVMVLAAAHIERVFGPAGTTEEASLTTDPVIHHAVMTLEHRLEPHRDPSLAVAAVFGEHAGWLLHHLPNWFACHSQRLTTTDAFGEAFTTTALAGHHPNLGLLEALQPGLSALVRHRRAEEPAESRRQDQSLAQLVGDRVLKLYLWGHIELDHPLVTEYHAVAPLADRAAVISELGWQMVRSETVETTLAERAMILWNSRRATDVGEDAELAELAGYESWVRSDAFPASWWLPRLVALAERVEIEGLLHVGDQLVAAAFEHLHDTLHALDLLVRQSHTRTGTISYSLRRATYQILEQALRSPDADIFHRADDLLNFLGRHGGVFIDPELAALAEAGITFRES